MMGLQMADMLTGYAQSLEDVQAFDLLDRDIFSLLFPTIDRVDDPVIPKGTPWPFKPLPMPSPVGRAEMERTIDPSLGFKNNFAKAHRPIDGSNNWAISGKKTATGRPYLAADLHINLRLPAAWYGIHLMTPSLNVTGISLPGAPGILVGFNESIAWGVTNAAWSVRDWYAIDFKDSTCSEYYCGSLLLKAQKVVEAIKVRDAEVVYDTVVYTHVGPIVYDDCFNEGRYYKNLAMRWEGHHPGNEIFAFYLLNRAKNLNDFEKALTYYCVPIQNFVFASVENDIAMQVAGHLPLRFKDQGRFVMPAKLAAYHSPSYIPASHQPRVVNPLQAYVSSANQRTTDRTYPYYYFQFFEEPYRNRRINQLLGPSQKVDAKAMMRLQNDNYNLAAQENLAFLLQCVDTAQLENDQVQAYGTLLSWNFENDTVQVAPSIFEAWQKKLISLLWPPLPLKDCLLVLPTPSFYHVMQALKNQSNTLSLKLGSYTSLQALVLDSFKGAVKDLQGWQEKHQKPYKWGDYHPITIPHLAYIDSFGLKGVCVGGGEGIVNANQESHGASVRLLVSLEKTPRGWLIYPGGQTGHPGSPYYTQLVEDWCKGRYVPLSLTLPPKGKRLPGGELILLPAEQDDVRGT
jgi:penicillin amidase